MESYLPHYPLFQSILEANGFTFKTYDSPYDVYHDGENEVRICEPCRRFVVNGKSIINPTRNIERSLLEFLFNNKHQTKAT